MKVKTIEKFKFVKGQTVFIIDLDFYISVRKIKILELVENHDFWDDEGKWHISHALMILEDDAVDVIAFSQLPKFVTTSPKKALNFVKRFTKKVDHFNLATKSYFVTEY